MRYRAVPGTSLRLSEIGFGCGGNAGLMVRGSAAEQRRVIARALDLGVTYFDVAPDYGAGAAEQALGDALTALGARDAVVTTKVEVRACDLGDIAGHVERSAKESLKRLGRDRIDILQLHNGPTATLPAMAGGDYHYLWIEHFLGAGGAVEGLRRVLADGIAAHVGFVSRGNDVAQVQALLDTGLFSLINLQYSLIDPSAAGGTDGGVLEAARRSGCGVAAFSPLGGGLLSDVAEPNALARPRRASVATLEHAARFGFLASADRTLAQAAYQFVLRHPAVTTAIGGFSAIEQVEEITVVSETPPLSEEAMARIEALWATPERAVPA